MAIVAFLATDAKMIEPAKSANQVVDELAEENARLKDERARLILALNDRQEAEALAQAEHHFEQILVYVTLPFTDGHLTELERDVKAHARAGLDACRNTKAGKEQAGERCDYCGDLDWTVSRYGRVTHKEGCPNRTEPWSQSAPRREER